MTGPTAFERTVRRPRSLQRGSSREGAGQATPTRVGGNTHLGALSAICAFGADRWGLLLLESFPWGREWQGPKVPLTELPGAWCFPECFSLCTTASQKELATVGWGLHSPLKVLLPCPVPREAVHSTQPAPGRRLLGMFPWWDVPELLPTLRHLASPAKARQGWGSQPQGFSPDMRWSTPSRH